MKKIIHSVLFLLLAGVSHAQYYYVPEINAAQNPGNLNNDPEYPLGGGLAAGWTQILGPTNASPTWSAVQNMPFAFSFNGSPVTKFKVSSSGVLTFDVNSALAAPSYTRAALPSANVPDSSVCLWGLNALGTNDNIVTKVFGTAPNRQLFVFFTSYGYGNTASDGSNFTYWGIALDETSNNIHIVDQRSGGFAGNNKLSLGVQVNSTAAYAVNGSPDVTALAGGDASSADNSYYDFHSRSTACV